ncbi:MAG: TrmH family RNA methyltransferase [Sulfurimicrobium sp.]
MKLISSRDNSQFKLLKKLAHSARERRQSGRALLDGMHLIVSYLERIGAPQMLVVAHTAQDKPEVRGLQERLPGVASIALSDVLFRELAPVDTPSGILALVAVPELPLARTLQCIVLLEALQDPGNLGAILRSAAAAGVEAAYLSPGCADAWSPKVLRGGMGAHFALAIRENVDLVALARSFVGEVVMTSLQGETRLFDLNLSGAVAFVIGNEGAGVSQTLQETATRRVRIPMPGAVESLNAAAAAAVCFFERVRQLQ